MAPSIAQGDDGLPVEVVGAWAKEKHRYLCHYLDASRGARQRFLGPANATATFVDLFSAYGRAKIRETNEFVDGSAVAAWRASVSGSAPFTRVYVADIDATRRDACLERLGKIGAPATALSGGAVAAAAEYKRSVDPYGLHLAFLDPHSLGTLDFRIIEELAKLKRIDMLIHVSAMDLQRNLPSQLSDTEAAEFDFFAPGWRDHIDVSGPQQQIRRRLIEYWSDKVRALGLLPFSEQRLIRGNKGQRLYWLMLASRSKLAQDLWKKIGRADAQPTLL